MIPLDLETKPRLDLVVRFVKPPEGFDPAAVKYGNTKDPAKRAELLAQKERDHADTVSAYWALAKDRAQLNPLTAEIVCIGLLVDGKPQILFGDEKTILTHFWALFASHGLAGEKFVFWSGNGQPTENFDPDMIIKRSWILGVKISALAFSGRYLSNRFEDAAGRYLLYKRDAYCGLSRAADQLNLFTPGGEISPKSEHDPVQGGNFWQYWEGLREGQDPGVQRALATNYLHNDLFILDAIVNRIY